MSLLSFDSLVEDGSKLLFDTSVNFTVVSVVALEVGFLIVTLVCFISLLFCNTSVGFYSDSNMTHGDLCSVKYISIVNCFVLCYHVLRSV